MVEEVRCSKRVPGFLGIRRPDSGIGSSGAAWLSQKSKASCNSSQARSLYTRNVEC